MPDIGVFRDTSGNYYTCCCRVLIPNDYENCPRCKQKVISKTQRYYFTVGEEQKAHIRRMRDLWAATGREQAERVSARLLGRPFVFSQPQCAECCWPQGECHCFILMGRRWRGKRRY